MARDWRNQYYFRSWSQFQQIFWLLSSDKVTLTSCNSAEPSQGVFSLNGQKQQQTCFLFLRILNKKWGRDALWKLEKRNFDVHHFIRHFIFLCWIITVKCLRVVVLSVSMFCVCTKRGRALPPPIVTHHPAWHAEIQIIWPGTVGLTLTISGCIMLTGGQCDQYRGLEIAWRGPGVSHTPPSLSWWQPGGNVSQTAVRAVGELLRMIS